jgi:hypothetical protein
MYWRASRRRMFLRQPILRRVLVDGEFIPRRQSVEPIPLNVIAIEAFGRRRFGGQAALDQFHGGRVPLVQGRGVELRSRHMCGSVDSHFLVQSLN